MSFICDYKKHWIISYFISWSIILLFITIILSGVDPITVKYIVGWAGFLHFVTHIVVVWFYKNKECKSEQVTELIKEYDIIKAAFNAEAKSV